MLTAREIVRSTYGTWRLAHGDAGGMAYFDATEEGFWRSFRVAILLLPVQFLILALQLAIRPSGADLARVVSVDLIAYAIGWMAFPLAAHYLVMAIDREREYVGYIVAYNWSAILQTGVHLVMLTLVAGDMLPAAVLSVLGLVVFVALRAYVWFIAKAALGVGGMPAAGLVAVDVVIRVLLAEVKDAMAG